VKISASLSLHGDVTVTRLGDGYVNPVRMRSPDAKTAYVVAQYDSAQEIVRTQDHGF
jgi:hypothetical protein